MLFVKPIYLAKKYAKLDQAAHKPKATKKHDLRGEDDEEEEKSLIKKQVDDDEWYKNLGEDSATHKNEHAFSELFIH
jgi:hypothetical protein